MLPTHPRRAQLILAVAFASIACTQDSPQPRNAASVARVERADVASAQKEDDRCGIDTTPAHPDPDVLINRYLALDDSGYTLGGSSTQGTWLFYAYACPNDAPGWDGGVLVAGHSATRVALSLDTARFAVNYRVLRQITQDSAGIILDGGEGVELDTLVLVRTRFGWRIDSQVPPHVTHAGAKAHLQLRPYYQTLLDSLARTVPSGAGGA